MNLISWAKKELARFKMVKNRRLLLSSNNQSSLATSMSLPLPPLANEIIIDADLGCLQCQRRLSSILTQIDEVESMVFHVIEKKLTFTINSTS